ncbi:hypothetical protein ACHAXA_005030 [Cyclostephanos tholiformis]|uniref:Uncharacterized protein n=1 Tax=Cyclostephanos tholiformis TaxID=382380 RepID=A0ABD3SRP1_9STRA
MMNTNNYNGDTENPAAVESGSLELEGESSLSPFLLHRDGWEIAGADEDESVPFTPETILERKPRSDGSIAIKAITTTPRLNGYRDVKVEHFVVPSSNAASVRYYTLAAEPTFPILDYLTRVEYHVLSPGSELMDPLRQSTSHRIVDIDDDDDMFSTDFSQSSSVCGADVTSVFRGQVNFEDGAFASSYSRNKIHSQRRRIIAIVTMLISLVFIIGVACTVSSRSHRNVTSSEEQHEPPDGDNISNVTSSDASMPANVPNVTKNRNDNPTNPGVHPYEVVMLK